MVSANKAIVITAILGRCECPEKKHVSIVNLANSPYMGQVMHQMYCMSCNQAWKEPHAYIQK
jgi:hypothetical protein